MFRSTQNRVEKARYSNFDRVAPLPQKKMSEDMYVIYIHMYRPHKNSKTFSHSMKKPAYAMQIWDHYIIIHLFLKRIVFAVFVLENRLVA